MSNKLVDHVWSKIIERDSQAQAALSTKIAEVVEMTLRAHAVDGADASKLVSDEGRLEYALRRCLDHLTKPGSVGEMDYFIYYEYATGAAKRADDMLAE